MSPSDVYESEPPEQEYDSLREPLWPLLESCRGSLTQLTIFSRALWEFPIHTLQGLEQLSIYSATNLSNTTLLVHHCARLKSLSVQIDIENAASQFYAVLAAHPKALPNLARFKLHTTEIQASESDMESLAEFISEKKKLRCLDCSSHSHTVEGMQPLLRVLRSLPCLEVLGLDLHCAVVTQELYQALKRALPEGLTALRLDFGYDDYADEVPEDYSLVRSSRRSHTQD